MSYATSPSAAMPAATAKGSIAFSSLILTLITTRWLAGIVENVGVGFASEIAAVGLLGSMGIVLLLDMRLAFNARILVLGLVAWAFTGVLSLTSTSLPAPAAAVSLIALLMLYALVANALFLHFQTTSKASTIATFFVAFVVVGASLSIFQVATGHGFVEGGKQSIVRAFGSDVHPVSFAIQIVIAATGIECQRLKGGHRFGWIHAILLLLAGLALYLTFARTAWALAAATFGLGMFLRGGISSRLAISLLVLPTVVFALMSSDRFADLGSLPFFWSNFSFENVVFDYRYIDNSVSWRIVNWALGYRQALELPLLGHGPGQSAAASYFNLEMHNILLESFFEGGAIGLAAFLIVIAGFAKIHLSLPRETKTDRNARQLANVFGLSLFAAVVFSTSMVDQLMTVVMYLMLLACVSAPARPSA